jgi:glycosyltransferase involved in cell wall biosynthesis
LKLSIIIPVFNEEKTIVEVLKKVDALQLPHFEKEIIVVDDGSKDSTLLKLKNFRSQSMSFKIINYSKNQGKGYAVRKGIENASGDYIAIQDADLEYNPLNISYLVEKLSANIHVVYGTRLKRMPNLLKDEKNPLFLLHFFGNRFLSLLTSVLYGQWITDMETGNKLFSRKSVDKMRLRSKSFEFEPEITAKLLKRGYKILEIPITSNPRGYDEGKKLNAITDGSKALWTLIKYKFTD